MFIIVVFKYRIILYIFMIIRYTRCDKEFIKNMPPKLLAELIILDDVIPDDLQSALIRNNKILKSSP